METYLMALFGGALIGTAVSIMLIFNGRVTGISGIIYSSTVARTKGDLAWRWYFIAGLFGGGLILNVLKPEVFSGYLQTPDWSVALAGLLVGFGTILGSGCTSGHGVCGVSRMSVRSILATVTFIGAGVLTAFLIRQLGLL